MIDPLSLLVALACKSAKEEGYVFTDEWDDWEIAKEFIYLNSELINYNLNEIIKYVKIQR